MKKKIAIIGASYLQMPLILKAKQMNIETHCFAWKEGAVCRDISDYFYEISTLDKEQILAKCQNIGIDGITTIATDIAMPTVSYIANKLKLTGNPLETSIIATNKFRMRQKFEENGINSPSFWKITDLKELKNKIWNYPLIVKPTDRSGSRGVEKVNNYIELEQATICALKESISNEAIIESYIEGKEVSIESISYQGEHQILAITDKLTTGAPHFIELGHNEPSILPIQIQTQLKNMTYKALNALNHQIGASHSEFKITPDGRIYIIEIGLRMGGDFIGSDLVYLSTGFDFVKAVIELALGTNYSETKIWNKKAGIRFFNTQKEYDLFLKMTNNSSLVRNDIIGPEIQTPTSSADRHAYIIFR